MQVKAQTTTTPYRSRLAKLKQALSLRHSIVSKEMIMPGVDESDDDIEQQILMMLLRRAMSKEDCIPEMALEFVQGFSRSGMSLPAKGLVNCEVLTIN